MQALTSGGWTAAVVAFGVAALTLSLAVVAAAVVAGRAGREGSDAARAAAPAVKRWGGGVLAVVGTWFLVSAVWSQALDSVLGV